MQPCEGCHYHLAENKILYSYTGSNTHSVLYELFTLLKILGTETHQAPADELFSQPGMKPELSAQR